VALEYMRNSEIVHRDLKPGNILFDKIYHLKLIDFSTAKLMNQKLAAKIPKKKVIKSNDP
jgi:serine/threonine protein kinase